MIIRIMEASDEPGYMYDVWLSYDEPEDVTDIDPDDGGICTSKDINIAIEQATDTAKTLVKLKKHTP